MTDGQNQRGGPNSQQIQVAGDLVLLQGVTEERAKEIAADAARKVVEELTTEAGVNAAGRIGAFDEALVEKLALAGELGVFADPAFHVILKRAQLGAASSEREADYDMLAELLTDRARRGQDRKVRAGIHRAIEIVDQVDDEALAGLTVLQAASQFRPTSGDPEAGLDAFESLFEELITGDLPTGMEWIDHLEILDTVRISQVSTLKKFEVYFPAQVPGYVCRGLEAGSDAARIVREKANGAGLRISLVDHLFRPGFLRLPYVSVLDLEQKFSDHLTPEQRQSATEIARDLVGIDVVEQSAVPLLMEQLDQRPHLKRLREWWNQIPVAVTVTSAGRVLARSNAKRCDHRGILPALD